MKKTLFNFGLLLLILISSGIKLNAQVPGETCNNPIVISSLPFNDTGNTSTYGDNYDGSDVPTLAPGAITNGTGSEFYITGDEVVYAYTPTSNEVITISTTNDNDWIGLWAFTGCPFASTVGYHTSTSGATREIPDLPLTAGVTYYFVISTWASPQSTDYTISILPPPTCPEPSALNASNIMPTSVDLGWTENGAATAWDIEWGVENFTPTGIPDILGTATNPHQLSGLSPQTMYDFYVRANCGVGDESTWVGPYTFQTACTNQLSGSYTIGATGDYLTLSDAVSELNACGISGSVTFNVLPGSGPYNEQIAIVEISGASSSNTITLNGNGETLTSTTTSSDRHLILLDGADYVTIVNFNLVTQSDTNNFPILLTNNADYNVITSNVVDMTSTLSSTGTTNAGILVSGSTTSATSTTGGSGTNNVIVGNTIIGGYYGINVNGQSATPSLNNIISNNTVKDFYSFGISLRYNNNSVVANNEVSRPDRSSVTTFNGIYLTSGGEGNVVSANNIHTPFGGITGTSTSANYGIYHASIDAGIGNENTVINNIVHLTGNNGIIYALYNSGSDGVHYYHNTVVLDDVNATAGTTRGFYQTTTADNIELKNNIFSITREGTGNKHCLYFATAASTIVSDNNVLYLNSSDGTNGIGYSGSNQTTLADWQTETLGDMNSVDLDPLFVNPITFDFVPSNPGVNNIGVSVGVTTDINGDPRDATTPDAGAYEFTPPACPQPSDLNASNITDISAEIGWTENGISTTWDIEWGTAGFTPTEVPNITGTTLNPHPLTGLTELTDYDFYVRADCGGGDQSIWVGPFSFASACGAFSVPSAMEDFEDFGGNINTDPCWSEGTGELVTATPLTINIENGKWAGQNFANDSGHSNGNAVYINLYNSTNSYDWLISPAIDLTTGVNPVLEFETVVVPWSAAPPVTDFGDHEVHVVVSTDGGITWSDTDIIYSIDNTNYFATDTTISIPLTGYTGIVKIGFYAISDGTTPDLRFYIDNFIVTGDVCDAPTSPILDDLTDTTAEISWTASATETGGYAWYVFADGDDPTTDPSLFDGTVATGTTTVTVSGLTAETDYDIYVSTLCNAGEESDLAGPLSFTTDVSGPAFPAPYCGPISFAQAVEPITNVVVAGISNTSSNTINGSPAHEDFTAITGTMEQGLSYAIALEGNTDGNFTNYFTVFIDWNQNGILDDAGEVYEVGSIFASNGIDGQQATGSITVPGTATLGQTRMRVFKNYNTSVTDPCAGTNYGQVEDYTIEVIAATTTCLPPSGLAVDITTDTTVDFSWTASPDETDGYIWAVMASGDDPDMDTPVDDGTTTTGVTMASASGLTPTTVYDLYVQTDCGTEESTWFGPVSFTTPATPPVNDECANAIMLTVGAVFADEQVVGTNTGATNDPNDPIPTCDNANFATNGKDVWYTVQVPASGSITVETMSNSSPGMSDTGLEIYSGSCGTLNLIDCNADGGTGNFSILSLTGLTAGDMLLIRVWGYNNNVGEFLVSAYDDTVCEMPSNLMIDDITDTEIEFSWTPPADISDVDGYYWRLMNSGDDPFVDPSVDEDYVPGATSTSAMITGLTPGTDYDLYLVTVCDEVSQFVSDFMMLAVTTNEVFVCEVPTDAILVNVDANFADISWTASATETDGYEWVVMASGENPDTDTPVATGNVGTGITTATVTGLDPLTDYDFYVRTNCDPDGMSDWEGPLAFTTLDTAGVNDNSLEGFTFYPNPMVDVITINAQTEIDEVIIFSLTGQRLVDQKVGATTSQIDVSHFASGPYLMQVTTSTGKIGIYRLIKK